MFPTFIDNMFGEFDPFFGHPHRNYHRHYERPCRRQPVKDFFAPFASYRDQEDDNDNDNNIFDEDEKRERKQMKNIRKKQKTAARSHDRRADLRKMTAEADQVPAQINDNDNDTSQRISSRDEKDIKIKKRYSAQQRGQDEEDQQSSF